MERMRIVDVTLRDGDQTEDVDFPPKEKLTIAKSLFDLGVNTLEVASVFVPNDQEATRLITDWAEQCGKLHHVEVLGLVDGGASVNWILEAGGRTMNLLVKGSRKHCVRQLGVSPTRHRLKLCQSIEYALKNGLEVNIYLEDWSNGMLHSPRYVEEMMKLVATLPIRRVMLCDTMGTLNVEETGLFVHRMASFVRKDQLVDFHGHNDRGLVVACCLEAARNGATGIHVSTNGLGERAGNAPTDEVVANLHEEGYRTSIDELKLVPVAKIVASLSRAIHQNKPISGEGTRSNVAGIHGDGDSKGKKVGAGRIYVGRFKPERFGNDALYPLSRKGGKAAVRINLEALGFSLGKEEVVAVAERAIELMAGGQRLVRADLFSIVAQVLNRPEMEVVSLGSGDLKIDSVYGKGALVSGTIICRGERVKLEGEGVGSLNAFLNGVVKRLSRFHLVVPHVVNFEESVTRASQGSQSIVSARIEWRVGDYHFSTTGVDPNAAWAPVDGAVKAINIATHNGFH